MATFLTTIIIHISRNQAGINTTQKLPLAVPHTLAALSRLCRFKKKEYIKLGGNMMGEYRGEGFDPNMLYTCMTFKTINEKEEKSESIHLFFSKLSLCTMP